MSDKFTKMSGFPVVLSEKTSSLYVLGVSIEKGLPTESVTSAVKQITVEHTNIHGGLFFEYPLKVDIGAGEAYNISLKTPSNKYIHYRNEKLSCSADKLTISLQELPTVVGGTTVTAINHSRVSTNTSAMVIKTGVTVSTAGTTISIGYIGGGTGVGGSRSGGETSQENEYVLKTNSTYAVTLLNNSSTTNTVVVSPQWYEEENG